MAWFERTLARCAKGQAGAAACALHHAGMCRLLLQSCCILTEQLS